MKFQSIIAATLVAGVFTLSACGGAAPSSDGADKAPEAAAAPAPEKITTKTMNLDLTGSDVAWRGEILGFYSHEGTLNFTEGSVELNGDQLVGGSFTVDMTTMKPTDENYNPEEGHGPDQLVGHLASADFFDVENHPSASFKITSVEGTTAKGMMTIRGKSNEETVENISVMAGSGKSKLTGTMTIDRQKYDVNYTNAAKEKVLSDDISLKIALVARESAM